MAESVMACSRPNCTATRPPWRPTVDGGRDSTTSRSRYAPGYRGSTRSGSTPSSTTSRRPSLKPTTVTDLRPRWHERSKPKSLRQTQAGSVTMTAFRLCIAASCDRHGLGSLALYDLGQYGREPSFGRTPVIRWPIRFAKSVVWLWSQTPLRNAPGYAVLARAVTADR